VVKTLTALALLGLPIAALICAAALVLVVL
jgi:hypothetical protein